MTRTYVSDRGDIVWLQLDPRAGGEQSGPRPAIPLDRSRHAPPSTRDLTLLWACSLAISATYYYLLGNSNYGIAVIRSFRGKDTERLFDDYAVKRFRAFLAPARRKLKMLHDATSLDDLAALRGNRLEALKGNRKGQHSIRINDQYRICFEWRDGDAYNVEIVDYH